MKVAIQGELGSFSHQAATDLLGEPTVVPCTYSADVFARLSRGLVAAAVVPIENSLAGSVLEHYDLLLQHRCYIAREHRLRIVHNLIAPPRTSLQKVRRVFSHPIALAQCRGFFRAHKQMTATAFYDTAGSVKHIQAEGLTDAAAIASSAAAKTYGARILLRGIEDDRANFTRFLLVRKLRSRRLPLTRGANKTSLAFSVKDRAGVLSRALLAFASEEISLTKIESRPITGKPWKYAFFVDLASGDTPRARRAFAKLDAVCEWRKLLGIYPAAAD